MEDQSNAYVERQIGRALGEADDSTSPVRPATGGMGLAAGGIGVVVLLAVAVVVIILLVKLAL